MAKLEEELAVKIKAKKMLLQGKVMHARSLPKANKFEYENLYFYFPLTCEEQPKNKFFSFNKFNLFSFFDKDHDLLQSNSDCLAQIQKIFAENQIDNIKNIILISHPRILGYAFNPASFWLGFDEEENLIVALVEVCNTFSQKHCYLLFNKNLCPIESNQWLEAEKEFYVSPFFEKKGNYKFRFNIKKDQLDFYINYYAENQLRLTTSLKCQYQELNDKNLIFSLLKMPFLMFKTIFLIHYQAFKLWVFKGAKYQSLPPKLNKNLTVSINEKK